MTVGSPGPGRTYEEVEKRRGTALGVRPSTSSLASVLLVAFLITAGLFFYLLVIPWTGLAPPDYLLAEISAILAAVTLFGSRVMARHGRMSLMRASLLALTDTLAFVGFVGLATWTLVFPLLYPFPPEIIVVGVFALIVTAAMVVVLRFAQPGASAKREGGYSDVEFTLKQLGEAVEELSRRLPKGERNVDPAVSERLATMMNEVAAMRKDFATMRSSGSPGEHQSFAVNPSVSGARTWKEPQAKPTVIARPVVAGGTPAPPPREQTPSGMAVPDSTVDNPWLDVLNKRKKKA